ncbi:UDP-glucose 4-epimerase GalE [Polynucleobacter sp. MWH-Berg-3C6]|uniref:UDP-glucose 4-epimerase GalE n=1 Tax=Polynucleobacter sp. MWH-Berg-3C6 TaxID=1855882 RepID=UPI001C0C5DAC|nr:UDP-glucose 4-epimerase GalE [Polynucleobacter sp. MWH-Berg-3C6]MBU3549894.1 UDP-glucose 4-epimerase GalE [Polynucleobacter sp. MWH-Berg-3C6]
MKILLTGGAGYIGSHAAVVLSQAGHEVIIFDNFSNSSRSVISRLENILNKKIVCIEGNICDFALLENAIQKNQIEAVIHFAGLKAVGESNAKPLEYYANNVQGTISLLQAMQATGVKKIIFSSSATVYGAPKYSPIDEEYPLSATNPYGRSKIFIEKILQDLAISDQSWSIVCLRYFNPVGAHESGLIGEDPEGIPNNLMPYLAQVAIGKLAKVYVFGDDYQTLDGTGVRDYIHVMDLAEGHLAALAYACRQTGFEAINLGTGKGSSVLEIIKGFEVASKKTIPYEIVGRRFGDVAVCFAKADLAKKKLGWSAKRDLSDAFKSAWKWQNLEGK